MLTKEQLLNSYKVANDSLCKGINAVNKFCVKSMICIGDPGPDGRLLVKIGRSCNKLVPNCNFDGGSYLFLLSGTLPLGSNMYIEDSICFRLLGSAKCYETQLDIYFLVDREVVYFISYITRTGSAFNIDHMDRYGKVILARIRNNKKVAKICFGSIDNGKNFDIFFALRHIAGLNANFYIEETKSIIYAHDDIFGKCDSDSKVFSESEMERKTSSSSERNVSIIRLLQNKPLCMSHNKVVSHSSIQREVSIKLFRQTYHKNI